MCFGLNETGLCPLGCIGLARWICWFVQQSVLTVELDWVCLLIPLPLSRQLQVLGLVLTPGAGSGEADGRQAHASALLIQVPELFQLI